MSVKVVNGTNEISLSVSEDLLVKHLYDQIATQMKISDFSLRIHRVYLLEKKLVNSYLTTRLTLMNNKAFIPVEINDITFQMTTNQSTLTEKVSERVSPKISIGDLKKRILTKVRINSSNKIEDWRLMKNSNSLEDEDLLEKHIEEKIIIVVLFRVMVKVDDRNFMISADKDMTIREFKKVCSEKIGQAANEYILSYNGEFLEIPTNDEDDLMKRVISIFKTVIESNGEERKKLEERTFGSYGIDIAADSDMTIGEFKKVCSEMFKQGSNEGIPFDNEELSNEELEISTMSEDFLMKFFVLMVGTHIENTDEQRARLAEKTLGSYGIENNAVLHVISTLRGGDADFKVQQ